MREACPARDYRESQRIVTGRVFHVAVPARLGARDDRTFRTPCVPHRDPTSCRGWGLGLRVDLLFDFPIRAREVRRRSTRRTIQSYAFHIASRHDLIRMKEIAANDRRASSDLQDLEFLKQL